MLLRVSVLVKGGIPRVGQQIVSGGHLNLLDETVTEVGNEMEIGRRWKLGRHAVMRIGVRMSGKCRKR